MFEKKKIEIENYEKKIENKLGLMKAQRKFPKNNNLIKPRNVRNNNENNLYNNLLFSP